MFALASLSLVIWLVLMLGRGMFWRVSAIHESAKLKPLLPCRVIVIIPARNEADVIGEALRSLAHQDFGGELRVVVVDDNSTDSTRSVVAEHDVTTISGTPLPAGWTGKLWALQQGLVAVTGSDADFYLFTDADIQHDRRSVASLVAMAQIRKLDLVSHMVKLHCATLAEKLMIPAFVFFFFMLYPPNWISSARRKVAGAAGGCVLIRPKMLQEIGGLSAVRGEVIDDCALARAVKKYGGRIWLGLTNETASIRPYLGLADISKMISRSAFRQLDHSVGILAGTLVGLVITYMIPVVLGLSGNYVALAAWIVMTVCYLPMVRFYRLNPLWALTLPLTAVFYLAATVHSALNYWQGIGGEWKGRAQDQRS